MFAREYNFCDRLTQGLYAVEFDAAADALDDLFPFEVWRVIWPLDNAK